MADIIHIIASYKLDYRAGSATEDGFIAIIRFYDFQNRLIGSIAFKKDGEPLSNNKGDTGPYPHRVELSSHQNQMAGMVDMLRNEKPCTLYWYDGIGRRPGGVRSGIEPAIVGSANKKEPLKKKTASKKKTSKKSSTKKKSSKRKVTKKSSTKKKPSKRKVAKKSSKRKTR